MHSALTTYDHWASEGSHDYCTERRAGSSTKAAPALRIKRIPKKKKIKMSCFKSIKDWISIATSPHLLQNIPDQQLRDLEPFQGFRISWRSSNVVREAALTGHQGFQVWCSISTKKAIRSWEWCMFILNAYPIDGGILLCDSTSHVKRNNCYSDVLRSLFINVWQLEPWMVLFLPRTKRLLGTQWRVALRIET